MAKSRVILLIITAVCSVLGLSNAAASDYYDDTNNVYVISDNSNCSSLPTELKGLECHPLSFYVMNVSKYFTNNTKMLITAGTHELPLPHNGHPLVTVVNVTGISNFSMIGIGPVRYSKIPSDEGSPLPSSTILCSVHKDKPRNGILFHKTSAIHIENLSIEDCGAHFTIPDNNVFVSALTFHESYNINLVQIRIARSLGFGLDADRIFGTFRVWRSAFLRCIAYRFHYQHDKLIRVGGNARFCYSKHNTSFAEPATHNNNLDINQSWFLHCGRINSREQIAFNFAGGLIIRIFIPSVQVFVNNSKLNNNAGSLGGNLAILVTDFNKNTSSITINDSVIANGRAIRGGGMQFWVQNHNFNMTDSYTLTQHHIMKIYRTTFENNSANHSGGGIYIGHYQSKSIDHIVSHIHFKDCTFYNNSVRYKKSRTKSYTGAAVQVIRHNIDAFVHHTEPQYSIEFNECSFENNNATNEGGILDFVSTQSVIITDCNFTFNEGTAISLRQSNIKFYGHTTFKGNRGRHGGALKFCELSKMYLPNNEVNIDFIENNASESGGAIYTSQQLYLETAPACFFQPIQHQKSPWVIKDLNITLRFRNNTARYAGDAVCGGQVDDCYLYYSSYDSGHSSLSKSVFEQIFDLKDQRKSLSPVSSIPYCACFYDISPIDELHCKNKLYPSTVYPGQSITLHLAAVGQRNGTSLIKHNLFHLKKNNDDYCSKLESKPSNTSDTKKQYSIYISLEYTIYSNQSVATFNLRLLQTELSHVHCPQYQLNIKLGECPWGFELDEDKCVCETLLNNNGIFNCDIDTLNITRSDSYWLGCANSYQTLDTSANISGSTTFDTKCKGVTLANRCFDFYCKTNKTNITSSTLDNQCTEGREGILCGRCKANYSLALGTQRCLPSCPVYMVYIVVLTCAAGGIMLILFLIACNFTVSEGTINGLLFYAHVVHKNAYVFFPGTIGTSNNNIFRLFIAWLNLDIGFEVCFYRSMNQYQKVWLQFTFLFYIWTLIFLIVMLSRRYIFFTRLVGRNIVKVLATLSLVCFPIWFKTALSCLEFVHLRSIDHTVTTIWRLDGNIQYLTGKHIPLFILGISLCLLSLFSTLALLFIQCLQRNSNLFCLTWVNKLRPFFDAYTGPCHVNYRFWPGCLFFARLVLFTLNAILINKHSLNIYIIITTCVVVQICAFVLPNGVYKQWTRNVLESTFFLNLIIVSGLVVYFSNTSTNSKISPEERTQYIVYPSVALTMVLFAGILIYHCAKQVQSYRFCRKLRLSDVTERLRFNKLRIQRDRDEEREPFLQPRVQQNMHQVVRFNQYREELIED